EWFHIVAWGGLAELCKQRLHKGSRVYVEGRLQTRSWKSSDHHRHYRTELVAQEIIFLNDHEGASQLADRTKQRPDKTLANVATL
ncbi:MAG: single-stranded DNA-binding protein, partial [Chloroflexi bacterium]